jgi:hypothetical protein
MVVRVGDVDVADRVGRHAELADELAVADAEGAPLEDEDRLCLGERREAYRKEQNEERLGTKAHEETPCLDEPVGAGGRNPWPDWWPGAIARGTAALEGPIPRVR